MLDIHDPTMAYCTISNTLIPLNTCTLCEKSRAQQVLREQKENDKAKRNKASHDDSVPPLLR
jgi:hypothetical protein